MWEDFKLRRMKKDSNSLKNMVGHFPFSFEFPERRVCLPGPSTSIRPSSLDTSERAVYF